MPHPTPLSSSQIKVLENIYSGAKYWELSIEDQETCKTLVTAGFMNSYPAYTLNITGLKLISNIKSQVSKIEENNNLQKIMLAQLLDTIGAKHLSQAELIVLKMREEIKRLTALVAQKKSFDAQNDFGDNLHIQNHKKFDFSIDLTDHEMKALKILSGEIKNEVGGAWLNACCGALVKKGLARNSFGYEITEYGRKYLESKKSAIS